MPPDRFTYDIWSAGSLATFGLETRYASIVESRRLIAQNAVGYCLGESLSFRPKPNTVAVMFEPEGLNPFWTHLTTSEFTVCFPEVTITQ